MNMPFDFEYYIKKGIVKKKAPNISRAEFLMDESSKSLIGLNERLKKIGINRFNANSIIKDCHDIIIENLRARMLIKGFEASGNNAHEAEVAYMKKLSFSEFEISMVNSIRKARNGINYYGEIFDVDYAHKVVKLMKEILDKLGRTR